jgi:hypothetical protein
VWNVVDTSPLVLRKLLRSRHAIPPARDRTRQTTADACMGADLPLAGRWRACGQRCMQPCVHSVSTERHNDAVDTILYDNNRLYGRHQGRKTALVGQEEHGMATHPRRSRATRASATMPQPEETPLRKKAGRPQGPPSTIINLRIPVALVTRLDH